jgi:hypothetical protein
MPEKSEKQDEDGDHPRKNGKHESTRVSLQPLTIEEAMNALLETPPEQVRDKAKQKQS